MAPQEDVVGAYKTIRGELAAYGHGLDEKQEILALNKVDALSEEDRDEKLAALRKASGGEVLAISAVSHLNTDQVLYKVIGTMDAAKKQAEDEARAALDDNWAP